MKRVYPDNQLLASYLSWMQGRNLSVETQSSYMRIAEAVFNHIENTYGFIPDTDNADLVKGYMLLSYVNSLTCADSSKNYYIGLVKTFFGFIHTSGYASQDASQVLIPIKIRVDDDSSECALDLKCYTAGDVSDLMSICRGKNMLRDRAIIAFLCGTGLRASELCSLTIKDWCSMQNDHIYVRRKGGSKRWVPVASYAIDHVETYLKARTTILGVTVDDPLFPNVHGQFLTRSNLYRTLSKWQRKIDLMPGVHIFRHTALTGIAKSDGIEAAQRQANHTSASVTRRYVHSTSLERLQAVNRSAIARAFDTP